MTNPLVFNYRKSRILPVPYHTWVQILTICSLPKVGHVFKFKQLLHTRPPTTHRRPCPHPRRPSPRPRPTLSPNTPRPTTNPRRRPHCRRLPHRRRPRPYPHPRRPPPRPRPTLLLILLVLFALLLVLVLLLLIFVLVVLLLVLLLPVLLVLVVLLLLVLVLELLLKKSKYHQSYDNLRLHPKTPAPATLQSSPDPHLSIRILEAFFNADLYGSGSATLVLRNRNREFWLRLHFVSLF